MVSRAHDAREICFLERLRMILSENRFPPPIKSGAGFFGIMRYIR